jgi:hypothetical protein
MTHPGIPGSLIAAQAQQIPIYQSNGWVITAGPLPDEDEGEIAGRHLVWWDLGRTVAPLVDGLIPAEFIVGGGSGGLAFADVGAMFTGGTHTGITFAYNSGTHKVNATVSGGGGATDPEIVRDTIAAALAAGAHTGITVTPNDAGDSISLAVITEYLQDLIASMFTGGVHTNASVAYNDTTGVISITASGGGGGTPGPDTITSAMIVNGTITRTDVDATIPAFNTDGSLDVADAAAGVEPDAGTAASHGYVDSIAATIVGLIGNVEGNAFSGQAVDVFSGSSVGQGNVEDDLSTLDMEKADGVVVDQKLNALSDTHGIRTPIGDAAGVGTRSLYRDDFRWHADATVSGSIGETRCLRDGGSSAQGTNTSFRPGVLHLNTGATINTLCVLHAPAQSALNLDSDFDVDIWFRPVLNGFSGLDVRAGLSSLPTSETPGDAIFIQHLSADSAFWRFVSRTTAGGEATPVVSTIATVSNQYVHLRIRRVNATQVGFSMSTTSGGVAGPMSSETLVTHDPATVLARLFIQIKNTAASAKEADVDLWQSISWNLYR